MTPPLPTINLAASVHQQIADSNAANAEMLKDAKEDGTYKHEWNKYLKWLKENGRTADDHGRWLTRENLDLYFVLHVAKNRMGVRNTLQRIANALQWYADRREWVLEYFVVKNATWETTLLTCLQRQKNSEQNRRNVTSTKNVPGPHNGLKDIVPENDRLKVVDYIYRNRPNDWGEVSMSYTWGSNSAVRGDSTRKFVYCDLNLSYGFGPEREGPSSRALMLILRHGSIHKDQRDTDQQVACWRHRNYQLCSVFSTALKVVYTLSRDNTVSFLHEDKTKRCLWWDRPLIGWDDLSSASSAMTQIYKATGVIAPKVTHDCTQAIQYGGAEGLQPF